MELSQPKINVNKIKVGSFSAELPEPLDEKKRTFVTIEADCYETSLRDNSDGTFDRIFRVKLNGSTIVKQEGNKDTYVCKSKRSPSQRLRAALYQILPDEEFYEVQLEKIIQNVPEIIEFLKNK